MGLGYSILGILLVRLMSNRDPAQALRFGTIGGVLLTCHLLALMMSNAGGAWDNTKKYVEEGHFGGENSETHKGCVVGDTVGDPAQGHLGPIHEYSHQYHGNRQHCDFSTPNLT